MAMTFQVKAPYRSRTSEAVGSQRGGGPRARPDHPPRPIPHVVVVEAVESAHQSFVGKNSTMWRSHQPKLRILFASGELRPSKSIASAVGISSGKITSGSGAAKTRSERRIQGLRPRSFAPDADLTEPQLNGSVTSPKPRPPGHLE